jgi:alanyl-tRNA synthetase
MTAEELSRVEAMVNEKILEGLSIEKREMPIAEAKKMGATALFGEKYGEVVRVVKMGDYSIEFCGGTHLDNTNEAGLFKIISEGGVAAGVRRIEGVTGSGVLSYIESKNAVISEIAGLMKSSESALIERTKAFVEKNAELKKDYDKLQAEISKSRSANLTDGAVDIKGVSVITASVDGSTVDQMREMIDNLKDKMPLCAVVLSSITDGKVTFVGGASKDAVAKGVHIGKVIKEVAAIAGGGGGGKPDSAQAGGKIPAKTEEAFAKLEELLG